MPGYQSKKLMAQSREPDDEQLRKEHRRFRIALRKIATATYHGTSCAIIARKALDLSR